jgi:hypothetical protein
MTDWAQLFCTPPPMAVLHEAICVWGWMLRLD